MGGPGRRRLAERTAGSHFQPPGEAPSRGDHHPDTLGRRLRLQVGAERSGVRL